MISQLLSLDFHSMSANDISQHRIADPTVSPSLLQTMAPRGWAPKGNSRHDWLHGRAADFHEALNLGIKDQWLTKTTREWFETYHWRLTDDVEPVAGAVYPNAVTDAEITRMNATMKAKIEVFYYFLNIHAVSLLTDDISGNQAVV